jgi:hypothetical protein
MAEQAAVVEERERWDDVMWRKGEWSGTSPLWSTRGDKHKGDRVATVWWGWWTGGGAVVTGEKGRRVVGFNPTPTVALGRAQFTAWLFFHYSNCLQTLKSNSNAFPSSNNVQTLQGAIFQHAEQRSPLAHLHIPTASYLINFWTNSNLNLAWILKGFKPCGTNLVNSLKFYHDLIFSNMSLVGNTCMQEIGVPIQGPIWLDLKIRRRDWIWNSNQATLGFHSCLEVT